MSLMHLRTVVSSSATFTSRSPAHEARALAGCERSNTARRGTVVVALRVALVAATLVACGGKRVDPYAHATEVQEACCEHLAGGARDACLKGIVRVEDPAVAKTSANEATYGCVTQHFACDAATGHATPASAQAQLECIQDLEGGSR
jgi:hypothetical protein